MKGLGWFCLGVLVGLMLAPAGGRATWHSIRNQIARAIDAMLRLGSNASWPAPRAHHKMRQLMRGAHTEG